MDHSTRQFIQETLLTTKEFSRLTGIAEITLKKRYERDKGLAVLKGRTLLWDRRDAGKPAGAPTPEPHQPAAGTDRDVSR